MWLREIVYFNGRQAAITELAFSIRRHVAPVAREVKEKTTYTMITTARRSNIRWYVAAQLQKFPSCSQIYTLINYPQHSAVQLIISQYFHKYKTRKN